MNVCAGADQKPFRGTDIYPHRGPSGARPGRPTNVSKNIGYICRFGGPSGLCETRVVPRVPGKKPAPAPIVSFREELAGRETLAAIAEARAEVFHPLAHRSPASTQIYGDRISNAPGAVSPKTARALDDAPEVTVSFAPAGPATYAVMDRELEAEGPIIEIHGEVSCSDEAEEAERGAHGLVQALVIEQQHTFIVREPSTTLKRPETADALLARLLPALGGARSADVTKLVIESHGEEGSLVRLWTKLR